jgi:hypothetical protein
MAGKANRKHGHNKRKPSGQRYTNEMRWERNKRRKVEKSAAFQSACKAVRSLAKDDKPIKDMGRRVRAYRALRAA